MFSSRDPRKCRSSRPGSARSRAPARSPRRSPSATALFFAVPYGALPKIGRDYGAALKGKIVLDACNAVAARDGAIADEVDAERHRRHLAEVPARRAPRARLQHDRLHDLRARGEPARSEAADPDRRRRCRGACKVAAASGARRRLRAGGRRRARRRAPLPARRARATARSASAAELRQKLLAGAVTARRRRLRRPRCRRRPAERRAALWSFAYFFALLAGYYVLRPLRDQMASPAARKALPWLFTATFVTLLRGAAALRRAGRAAAARALHPDRLSLLRRQPRAVLAAADARHRAGRGGARVLRLGQRVQPVRGRGVLVVHGRPVRQRAGQAPVRLHRRRRHGRRAARAGDHDRALGAARAGQPAAGRDRAFSSSRCSASGASSAARRRRTGRAATSARSAAAPSRRCPSSSARRTCSASPAGSACCRSARRCSISRRPTSSPPRCTARRADAHLRRASTSRSAC